MVLGRRPTSQRASTRCGTASRHRAVRAPRRGTGSVITRAYLQHGGMLLICRLTQIKMGQSKLNLTQPNLFLIKSNPTGKCCTVDMLSQQLRVRYYTCISSTRWDVAHLSGTPAEVARMMKRTRIQPSSQRKSNS